MIIPMRRSVSGHIEELRFHALAGEPDLIYQPLDWSPAGGREGVQAFLMNASYRLMAWWQPTTIWPWQPLTELQLRGLRVPYDVAVCGFDDIVKSSNSTPPLTTVRQPFHQMGRLALQALLAYHQGKSVPPRLFLPTTLQMRRSCGCLSEAVANVNQGMQFPKLDERGVDTSRLALAGPLLNANREVLLGEMRRAIVLQDLPVFPQMAGEWLEALVNSLEKRDNGEAFLKAIDLTSRRLMQQQISLAKLQDVLSALRRRAGARWQNTHPGWPRPRISCTGRGVPE